MLELETGAMLELETGATLELGAGIELATSDEAVEELTFAVGSVTAPPPHAIKAELNATTKGIFKVIVYLWI